MGLVGRIFETNMDAHPCVRADGREMLRRFIDCLEIDGIMGILNFFLFLVCIFTETDCICN
jgi:hypothetical protein